MSDSETNGLGSLDTEPGDPEAFGRPSCIRARLSHTRTCGATSPQGPVEFVAHGGRRNAQYTGEENAHFEIRTVRPVGADIVNIFGADPRVCRRRLYYIPLPRSQPKYNIKYKIQSIPNV